jgi:hypothetical protein
LLHCSKYERFSIQFAMRQPALRCRCHVNHRRLFGQLSRICHVGRVGGVITNRQARSGASLHPLQQQATHRSSTLTNRLTDHSTACRISSTHYDRHINSHTTTQHVCPIRQQDGGQQPAGGREQGQGQGPRGRDDAGVHGRGLQRRVWRRGPGMFDRAQCNI